jgi:hypothetical protein
MSRNIAAPDKPRKPLIRARKALGYRPIGGERSNGGGLLKSPLAPGRGATGGLRPPSLAPILPEDRL